MAAGVLVLLAVALNIPKEIKPEPVSKALAALAQGLDETKVQGVYDGGSTLTATQTMVIENRFGQPVEELVLRTYANAFLTEDTSPAAIEEMHEGAYYNGFSPGGIAIGRLTVDGAEVPVTYRDTAKTVLAVKMPTALEPGQKTAVVLEYTVTIPKARYRFGKIGDTVILGNVLPILAVYEDGAFRTEEYYPIGDPFVSDCANYTVQLAVPEGFSVYGTGQLEGDTLTALAVRDMALFIAKGYRVEQAMVDGVVINSAAKTGAGAKKALDTAKKALGYYNQTVGAYPYNTLTVAQGDVPFGGMEYPQLVVISESLYTGNDDNLKWTVAHEVAHQWFYGVVGSDQYVNPWQDEALCEYLVYNYLGKTHGNASREDAIFRKAETSMRVTVPRGVTPGSPIGYFSDLNEYSLVVYNRGSAMLVALEDAVGRDKMDAFLKAYYRQFAFKRATRLDFEETFRAVTGQDYTDLIIDYLDTHIMN